MAGFFGIKDDFQDGRRSDSPAGIISVSNETVALTGNTGVIERKLRNFPAPPETPSHFSIPGFTEVFGTDPNTSSEFRVMYDIGAIRFYKIPTSPASVNVSYKAAGTNILASDLNSYTNALDISLAAPKAIFYGSGTQGALFYAETSGAETLFSFDALKVLIPSISEIKTLDGSSLREGDGTYSLPFVEEMLLGPFNNLVYAYLDTSTDPFSILVDSCPLSSFDAERNSNARFPIALRVSTGTIVLLCEPWAGHIIKADQGNFYTERQVSKELSTQHNSSANKLAPTLYATDADFSGDVAASKFLVKDDKPTEPYIFRANSADGTSGVKQFNITGIKNTDAIYVAFFPGATTDADIKSLCWEDALYAGMKRTGHTGLTDRYLGFGFRGKTAGNLLLDSQGFYHTGEADNQLDTPWCPWILVTSDYTKSASCQTFIGTQHYEYNGDGTTVDKDFTYSKLGLVSGFYYNSNVYTDPFGSISSSRNPSMIQGMWISQSGASTFLNIDIATPISTYFSGIETNNFTIVIYDA